MANDALKDIMKAVRDMSESTLTGELRSFTKSELIDFIEEMKIAGVFSNIDQMYRDYCEIDPDEDDE